MNVKMSCLAHPDAGTSFATVAVAGAEDEVSAYHGWLICKEAYYFMATSDRRATRRLSVQLDVVYRKAGPILGRLKSARTQNVSAGGICFHTADDSLRAGTILQVELRIPPRHGVLETGGRLCGLAQVLRAHESCPGRDDRRSGGLFLVAARFCHRPTLCEVGPSQEPGPLKDLHSRPRHVDAAVRGVPG